MEKMKEYEIEITVCAGRCGEYFREKLFEIADSLGKKAAFNLEGMSVLKDRDFKYMGSPFLAEEHLDFYLDRLAYAVWTGLGTFVCLYMDVKDGDNNKRVYYMELEDWQRLVPVKRDPSENREGVNKSLLTIHIHPDDNSALPAIKEARPAIREAWPFTAYTYDKMGVPVCYSGMGKLDSSVDNLIDKIGGKVVAYIKANPPSPGTASPVTITGSIVHNMTAVRFKRTII